MTQSSPVRLAIVGYGRMGRFHGRTLAGVSEVEVVAVADTRPDAREAAQHDLGELVTVSSADELAGRAGVDAWLVASSTPSHPELVRTAIAAGLHVLCEKPLALDADEGAALGALAEAAETTLQVGFWRRFSPPWVEAYRLVRGGAIGRPLLVRLSQWDADPPPPRFCDPAVSGGLAVDCGVHEFDLVPWLTGLTVIAVRGHHLPVVDAGVGAAGDVDNLLAVLELTAGAVATVDLSRNARYGDDVRTEILGSDGAVFVDILPTGRTRLADADGVRVVEGSETDDATAAGVAAQARAFAAAVRGETVDYPGAAASNAALLIARSVEVAASGGNAVRVG